MFQATTYSGVRRFLQGAVALLMLFSSIALAENADKASAQVTLGEAVPQPGDYFSQILLSLIFILMIIFAAAWLLRRYGRFPGVAEGNLRVLGALSVGPRERILLLQAGKEQIVVGVTTSKISKLHQLSEPVEVEQKPLSNFAGGAFSQRLQEAMQPKSKTSNTEQKTPSTAQSSKQEERS